MTATQNYGNIILSTPILSADPNVKEDVMTDQQKITILYCRLSNEDSQDGESNSKQNQRELLTKYARDHGYTNLTILVDDGYTGTNFNRPGVQEGFELVKQGLVGCWLVKDLSRFGRDYLTVGQYTDIIFPSYDVRFIAVNDGVDSQRGDGEGFAAVRNLFKIRTNNVIERMNREIWRRTRGVGAFPDGNSALMLVCARLRHVAGTQWGCKKYMNMKHLETMEQEPQVG